MFNDLKSIRNQPIVELVDKARSHGIDNAGNMRKSDLVFELICIATSKGKTIRGEGVLDIPSEGFGFLRSPVSGFGPGTDDIYVSPAQIRRFNLRTGDFIEGKARTPRDGERYLALLQIEKVNGVAPEISRDRLLFETLPLASENTHFSSKEPILQDWIQNLGLYKGQRILIRHNVGRSSVRSVLTFLSKQDVEVVYLSLETPSEDIGFLSGFSDISFISPMGEGSSRHLQVANLALMRAKRLAELGKDVVFVFDSLWSYILCAQEQVEQQGKSGALATAISMFRFFWSAARKMHNGSLTVYALLPDPFCQGIARVERELLHHTHHELHLSKTLEDAQKMPPFMHENSKLRSK